YEIKVKYIPIEFHIGIIIALIGLILLFMYKLLEIRSSMRRDMKTEDSDKDTEEIDSEDTDVGSNETT
ncbi:MAG: hypothetical protein IJ391_03225, partial [Clostridia bacterium]|nr:hypothetical protein [Clostridia bacterium]